MTHVIMVKNLQLIKKNLHVQNVIHRNHHPKEIIIQHEVVRNQGLTVEDLVTGE
jgi:hypothetical protein